MLAAIPLHRLVAAGDEEPLPGELASPALPELDPGKQMV
jgi:hypothetical protein